MNYLCKNQHQITAPYALCICPLARCQSELREVGPNFGALKKSKAETAEHYAQVLADAEADA